MYTSTGRKSDSTHLLEGQFARNGVPIALAVGSLLYAIINQWQASASRQALPVFLWSPAIVGTVSMGFCSLSSAAAFVAIRKGEGYHSKNDSRRASELNHKTHHINTFGLRYFILIFGLLALTFNAAWLYMATFVIMVGMGGDEPTSDYCLRQIVGNTSECQSNLVLLILAFFLTTLAALFWLLELVMDGVERRFDDKKMQHRRGGAGGSGGPSYGTSYPNRQSASYDRYDQNDGFSDDGGYEPPRYKSRASSYYD